MSEKSIRDQIADIYTWIREPDYTDEASLDWLMDWVDRRPVADLAMVAMLMPDEASEPAWQPIETYDPAHELNVLVVDQGIVSEAYYDGESDTWFKEGKSEHDFDFVESDRLFPTHWMPMPGAPALSQAEGSTP